MEKVLIVSITSNKRFCGPFNKNTLEETGKAISDYQASIGEGNAYVYSIGEIGGKTYEKKGCQLTGSIKFPEKSIFEGATRIAEMLMKWFASGEYDAVEVVYHRFENAKSKVAREQFLPLPTKQAEKNDAGELAGFISEPSPDAIINALAPRLLKARFRGMLMSSYASESHLRMIAMTRAVKKTQELIDKLNRQFNKARQERITREIIEINAGAIPQ